MGDAVVDKKARQDAFLAVLATNFFNVTNTCAEFGINRRTYYKWLEDPTFSKRRDEIRNALTESLEGVGRQIALGTHTSCEGKPSADLIKFFLRALHPQFKDKRSLEVSGKVDHNHTDMASWTTEQLHHYATTGNEPVEADFEVITEK